MTASLLRRLTLPVALAAVAAAPRPALATDGHFLHGVGAVNSALGGAGVAGSASLLGAFFMNPAALAQFTGTHGELSMELFKPDRTVSSSAGPMSGSTRSNSEFVPVPAFGFTTSFKDGRVVAGLAGLGIGGFGVRYRADPTNPILAPRPNGFGQVYSNFSLLKVAPAIAWKAGEKLMLGAAVNVDWASLAVDPMPIGSPAVDPGPDNTPFTQDDRAYYSGVAHTDGAFGFGAQLGVLYAVTPTFRVGASYATPQVFEKFRWDAVYENPNLPNYNTARTIEFALDVPAVYAVGVAYAPRPSLELVADVKHMAYASTRGFKDAGFNPDGSVAGFGWQDIRVVALGAQWKASDRLTLRGGYNYSGNPIPDEQSMFNIPAPAVIQHHATAGIGFAVRPDLEVNVAYYNAFENSITGPIVRPGGALPGTSVTNALSAQSILIGFALKP